MSKPKFLKMKLDRNVLKHLGIKLYSSIPAVLSEAVANAWDADAEEVRIDICGKRGKDSVVITDDGHGMTCRDIDEKFLTVGYERRVPENNGEKTISGRPVMGRKGIGKLSLFSIARNIEVHSKKDGEKTAVAMDRKKLESGTGDYKLPVLPDKQFQDFPHAHGTRIVISNLDKKRLPSSMNLLRKRLARRFSIPCIETMKIILNDTPVTVADRDYFEKLAYLFQYGEDFSRHCPHLPKNAVETRQNRFDVRGEADPHGPFSVRGWIGFAPPSDSNKTLKRAATPAKQGENQILVMMRGKQAKDDILREFGISSFFGQYVFGEINADFLDETDKEDIATSSRQDIREDDPRFVALCKFMRHETWKLQEPWDELRNREGMDRARELLPRPDLDELLKEMSPDERKKLQALFGRINRVPDGSDAQLFACGLYVFERYRLKNALDALERLNPNNVGEFVKIAAKLGDLEAADYYAIVKTRLAVIHKLGEKVDANVQEKYLRNHLYKNLWLLSPSWERATAPEARMEQRVTKEFAAIDKKLSKADKSALGRVDIKYRIFGGAHTIVELKRASVNISSHRLTEQVEKYQKGLKKCLAEVASGNGGEVENVDAVCILGGLPSNWKDMSASERVRARENLQTAHNIRIVTYEKLISDAEHRYHDAIKTQQKHGRMQRIYSLALGEDGDD